MSGSIPKTMQAAFLPGDSTVQLRAVPVPEPGHGEVLIKIKASTICGSDIRCIYREHLGKGPEGYQGVICGHEPCGQIVRCGPGMRRFAEGDRVVVYHISGCGLCNDCRRGFMISCKSDKFRRAYGWQRDGGMAEYMLAEEKDLLHLPPELTYADGAQVACGFGTVYEAMEKIGINGNHAVLVVGLGPVGLAALMLAKALGANTLIGVDAVQDRLDLAVREGLADEAIHAGPDALERIMRATNGKGCERSLDCSASDKGRLTAIQGTRQWGKIAFVGEGGTVRFDPSDDIMHDQKTIHGSWVTSTWLMEELLERLVTWGIHPDRLITNRYPLSRAAEAYEVMAAGKSGKVAVCFDEMLEA
ncbi:MAG: zinc-binding dehydrogenase [Planctomycetaceae bacterium]|nr:zinc-binding dehydrogenase [Planctomycetaceae bacterium]